MRFRYSTIVTVAVTLLFGFTELANAAFSITSGPSAGNIKENSASISWSLSEVGTGQVRYGTTTSYGKVSILESSFNYSSHKQYISGLSPGTIYHYQVVSKNAAGVVVVSEDKTFVTAGFAITVQPAAINIKENSASITWSLSEVGTGQVRYGTTTAYGKVSILESSFDYSSHKQYISGLTPGTLYHFQVVSKNMSGVEVVSADSTFTTLGTAPSTEPPPSTGTEVPAGAINVKDKGAKGDGITDDLLAFQNAVAAVPLNGTLYVPAGKYMFNVDATNKVIKLKSNMKMLMDPNAILQVKGNNLERYYLISINGVQNVEVSGGRLVGDRETHIGTTGEWGYGIKVGTKANKILIHDVHISKFWGDGICTGGYAYDIEIRRVVSTQNRRQGLSITRSENVRVYDSEFSYTEGTAPQYGIDIEPDPSPDGYYAKNIIIQGCKIHHNKAGGIQAYKQSYGVVIKDNEISYNTYGVYTVESFNGTISGNTFAHNKYNGIALRNGTSNYTVSGNISRNNYTSMYGITNDTNPLVTITGVLSGASGTSPHLNIGSGVISPHILTNQYAK